jgi:hypothetical protein
MSATASRDKQELAKLVGMEEKLAREGKPVPHEIRELIAYYERHLAIIEGRG